MQPITAPWNSEVQLPISEDVTLANFRDNRTVWEGPPGYVLSVAVETVPGMKYAVSLDNAGDSKEKFMCITTQRGEYEHSIPYVPSNMLSKPTIRGVARAFCEDEDMEAEENELSVRESFWVHVWGAKEEQAVHCKLYVDALPV